MSFKARIDANLNRAFNLSRDLAVNVTFTKKLGSAFDFGTASATETGTTDIIVKGLWIDSQKKSSKIDSAERHIMLKRKDVGDVTTFDHLIEGSVTYKIGTPLKNDGYIIILSVFKET